MFTGGKQTKAAFSAAAILAILAVSACSSGGSNGPPLSRDALIAKANPICASAAQQIKSGATSVFPTPNQAGEQDPNLVAQYAKTVVLPDLQSERDQLGKLSSSDVLFPVFLSELQKGIDRWTADKTLMATVGDTSFVRFDSASTDLGFTACSGTDLMIHRIAGGTQAAP